MKTTQRKWDMMTKEKRDKLVQAIMTYFKNERDLDMGIIAAEDTLDFFLDALGPEIYNKAVQDSKNTIKQSFDNMEIDLDLLFQK